MVTLLLIQGAAVAMSFVALYAMMMNWCASAQVATDFAVLQSVDAMLAILMGAAAGLLGQHFGYGAIFSVTMVLLAVGAWMSLARAEQQTVLAQDLPVPPHSSSALNQETIR